MTMNESAIESERFHEYVQAGVPVEKAREYAQREAAEQAYFASMNRPDEIDADHRLREALAAEERLNDPRSD